MRFNLIHHWIYLSSLRQNSCWILAFIFLRTLAFRSQGPDVHRGEIQQEVFKPVLKILRNSPGGSGKVRKKTLLKGFSWIQTQAYKEGRNIPQILICQRKNVPLIF